MFKENEAKSAHENQQSDLTGLHNWRHTLARDIIKKRGKLSMITIDNMHQGYIFRVCSVALFVVQCYRFCWSCSFCLLALLHTPSWGWVSRRGSTCMLYFVAALALCVRVRGAGANLNTVKRIGTVHQNQINLLYIYIYIYNNSSEKVSIQMNLKRPCTSCSDWQPRTMPC